MGRPGVLPLAPSGLAGRLQPERRRHRFGYQPGDVSRGGALARGSRAARSRWWSKEPWPRVVAHRAGKRIDQLIVWRPEHVDLVIRASQAASLELAVGSQFHGHVGLPFTSIRRPHAISGRSRLVPHPRLAADVVAMLSRSRADPWGPWTMATGQCAACITPWLTEPRRSSLSPVRPRVPTTTRQAFSL
jgi:hypothetical protein